MKQTFKDNYEMVAIRYLTSLASLSGKQGSSFKYDILTISRYFPCTTRKGFQFFTKVRRETENWMHQGETQQSDVVGTNAPNSASSVDWKRFSRN